MFQLSSYLRFSPTHHCYSECFYFDIINFYHVRSQFPYQNPCTKHNHATVAILDISHKTCR